jgi:hypothetical protein
MKFPKLILVSIGLLMASSAHFGSGAALAQDACDEGWVRVGAQCALPDDLVVGDEIQVTIGSAVNLRSTVVGFVECGGHRTYYTFTGQTDCGWRDAVTAYSRTSLTTAEQAMSVAP